jgi:hypothetical protein
MSDQWIVIVGMAGGGIEKAVRPFPNELAPVTRGGEYQYDDWLSIMLTAQAGEEGRTEDKEARYAQ